jgi:HEAT repeat protein
MIRVKYRRGSGLVSRDGLCVLAVFVATTTLRAYAEEPVKQATAVVHASPAEVASPDDVARWIEELGDNTYTVRQAAAARLLSAGMPAREALLEVVDGPDPETRSAARRLVALIDQSEFHRRLEAFAADTDGRLNLTLPGWEPFQKLVGNDSAARALFVEMQRQEGPLLAAVFGVSKRTPNELVEPRLMRLIQWQNAARNRAVSPPLGSCAALLFLGAIPEIEISDQAAALSEILLQRPPMLEAMRSANRQDAARRLVVAWLLHCPSKSEEMVRRRLGIISNLGMEEALPLPLSVVSGEAPIKRVQAYTRALAVLVIGQLGRREHVEPIEPLLEDASTCFPPVMQVPGQPPSSVQVRDAALVAMLQLTEQRPVDYGYVHARVAPQPARLYQIQTLFRESDAKRTEAIAKWRHWRAAQKAAADPQKAK